QADSEAAKTHVATARSLVGGGDLDAAKKEFAIASGLDKDNREATDGLKAIQDRETAYTTAKTQAETFDKSANFDGAIRAYEQARAAHPQWFQRDNIESKVAAVNANRIEMGGVQALIADANRYFKERQWTLAKQAADSVLKKE